MRLAQRQLTGDDVLREAIDDIRRDLGDLMARWTEGDADLSRFAFSRRPRVP
jgi:hypothetical protein